MPTPTIIAAWHAYMHSPTIDSLSAMLVTCPLKCSQNRVESVFQGDGRMKRSEEKQ
jgi:hypothetical protein